jgi:short-chain fatty acids transporter
MNISCSLCLLVIIPLSAYFISNKIGTTSIPVLEAKEGKPVFSTNLIGAENIDYSNLFGRITGFIILIYLLFKVIFTTDFLSLRFINPDFINLLLFALGLFLHSSLKVYMENVEEAMVGAAGILIQFPLYFGIMGLMKSSGLIVHISDWFIQISNQYTYPIYTFISAGIVNIFVPSGGGQWAIQGPVIIEAAKSLNVSISKSIMAMAYGDQLTNMLQPFWALPLLGITKLKAKDILPYTLFFMLIGAIIFISFLLIF